MTPPPPERAGTPLRRLWVLMASVFIDMLGFLMVLPILPFYAERLGANATTIGLLIAAFSFAQLATSPLWGKLSDHWGRRPVLLIALSASGVAFVLFALADSVWMLFLSRLAQGAGGGTTGVAQAYVSDSVGHEERAKVLGWLSAATNAGVMIGPALGALATTLDPRAPGFVAAGLCFLNVLFAWRWLPESSHADDRVRPPRGSTRRALKRVLREPGEPVSALIWIYTAGMMAFFALNGVLALYLGRRFGVTDKTIGWFYFCVGAASLLMRTLVLGPAVRRFGERGVMRLGIMALTAGLLAIPIPHRLWGFALAMLLIPIGTALLFPATSSLISRFAPRTEVGQTLGLQQSFGAVARMLGPVWAGALFDHVSLSAPFWTASALMASTTLFLAPVERALTPARAPEPGLEPPAA
jgi:MFS family permease